MEETREITRRSVLIEALEMQEAKLSRVSVNGMKLIPLPGMKDEFRAQMEKTRILREMIQALESEPVRRVMADWQKDVMSGKGVDVRILDRVPEIPRPPEKPMKF